MSNRQWAHTCRGCGHLANVHIRGDASDHYDCVFCPCIAEQLEFNQGVTERVAREQHAEELAWISERWPPR